MRNREADALRDKISTLEWLLNEERDRSDDLLEKLLFAMAAAPAGSVVLPGAAPPPRSEPEWRWPDLQPEDEALSDVRAQVREGSLHPEEAKAILEAIGFPDAEIHTDD